MKAKKLGIVLSLGIAMFSCDPAATFLSSKGTSREEIINFDDFSATFSVGGLLHSNYRYIALMVKSKETLAVLPNNFRIYYMGNPISYDIYVNREEYDDQIIDNANEDKSIIYEFKLESKTNAGDTISFFGENLFKKNNQCFNLDTLNFIMKKPPKWYGGYILKPRQVTVLRAYDLTERFFYSQLETRNIPISPLNQTLQIEYNTPQSVLSWLLVSVPAQIITL